jgi:hypothetical protein
MTTTHSPGWQVHAKLRSSGIAWAAALLLVMDGAAAASAADGWRAAEATAGEAAAQAYCQQHRAVFAAPVPVITPVQSAAALAEGASEGPARQDCAVTVVQLSEIE